MTNLTQLRNLIRHGSNSGLSNAQLERAKRALEALEKKPSSFVSETPKRFLER